MGNVSGVLLGVGNRPRQGRAVLEILALIYILRKLNLKPHAAVQQTQQSQQSQTPQITSPPALLPAGQHASSSSSSASSFASSSYVMPSSPERTTTPLSFPDSCIPRRTATGASSRRDSTSSTSNAVVQPLSRMQRLNAYLRQYEPLQIVLGVITIIHLYHNLSLLLGLNAPHHSLSMAPDNNYSKDFANVRWLLTSLDAAHLATMKVKFPPLRWMITVVLSIYYLLFFRRAENTVEAFRRSLNPQMVRICWEKGSVNPVLATLDRVMRKKCAIDLELIKIQSPDGHEIECRLFYNKSREELANEKQLLLSIPGGGFLAMSPQDHAEYLSYWSQQLGVPILSVLYRKAPEFPFPCGMEDAWYVYKAILDTNGSIIGINSGENRTIKPIKLVIVGDSAGGNLAAAVTIKAITDSLRVPDGIHLIYPVLDFSGEIWKTGSLPPPGTQVKAREHKLIAKRTSSDLIGSQIDDPTHFGDSSSLFASAAAKPRPDVSSIASALPEALSLSELMQRQASTPIDPSDGMPLLSSRMKYAYDGVLPFKYLLLLADSYFRNGGDPVNNPLASPMAASDEILAQFPPIFCHVGSVDPLVDDTLRFARRAQQANPRNDVFVCVIPKVSHAYMHVPKFLPEAKVAVDLSLVWLSKLFDLPAPQHLDLDHRMAEKHLTVMNFKDTLHKIPKRVTTRKSTTDYDDPLNQASELSFMQLPSKFFEQKSKREA